MKSHTGIARHMNIGEVLSYIGFWKSLGKSKYASISLSPLGNGDAKLRILVVVKYLKLKLGCTEIEKSHWFCNISFLILYLCRICHSL